MHPALFALVLLLSPFVSPPEGPAPTAAKKPDVVVSADGSGTFTTIEAAVAAAAEGDVVRVKAGTYTGPFLLDRPLRLVFEGAGERPVLTAPEGTEVMETSADVTLEGLILRADPESEGFALLVRKGRTVLKACEVAAEGGSGIGMVGGEVSLESTTVRGCAFVGIHAKGKGRLSVAGGLVKDCGDTGIWVREEVTGVLDGVEVSGAGKAGIVATHGGRLEMRKCRVVDGKAGALLASEKGVIEGRESEVIRNRRVGVNARSGGTIRLVGSGLRAQGECGVLVQEAGTVILEDCVVEDSGLSGLEVRGREAVAEVKGGVILDGKESGILATEGARVTATKVDFLGNRSGLRAGPGSRVEVQQCRLSKNAEYGVIADDGSEGKVTGCDLRGNGKGAVWKGPKNAVSFTRNREK